MYLATVAFPELAADQSGLTEDKVSVEAQRSLSRSERPDIRLDFGTGVKGRVWCENKIKAGWTRAQRSGYPGLPPSDRVIFITPDGAAPNELPEPTCLRWNALARKAYELGRGLGAAREWRAEALKPNAEARYRVLAELLAYLERDPDLEVTVPGPLESTDLHALRYSERALDRTRDLFDLIVNDDQLKPFRSTLGSIECCCWEPETGRPRYPTGWAAKLGRPARWRAISALGLEWSLDELILAPNGNWLPRSLSEPVLAASVSIDIARGWPEQLQPGGSLRDAVDATDRVQLVETYKGRVGRVVVAEELAKILGEEETLDAQAQRAASWAAEGFERICLIQPSASERDTA